MFLSLRSFSFGWVVRRSKSASFGLSIIFRSVKAEIEDVIEPLA